MHVDGLGTWICNTVHMQRTTGPNIDDIHAAAIGIAGVGVGRPVRATDRVVQVWACTDCPCNHSMPMVNDSRHE